MKQVAIWAHRGSSVREPENTMAAFEAAIASGCEGLELDTMRTRDGELVVLHDIHTGRVAERDLAIRETDYAELQGLNVAHHRPDRPAARMPRLAEVLELIQGTDFVINIELKNSLDLDPELEGAAVELVRQMGVESQIWYSSFNHMSMQRLARMGLGARCGLLYGDILYEPEAYAKACGVGALHPQLNSMQVPGYVEAARAAGIAVHVWTVDRDEHLRGCLALGVDAIITNLPERALELRAEMSAHDG